VSAPASSLVIFTDLDGTLLDHHTYSWAAARPALSEIRRRGVPLVFCTSKTRAELMPLRRRLRNAHPFITENGGGVFVPRGYFRSQAVEIVLGRPYSEIIAALEEIARQAGARVRGFHQMSVSEIARATGLSRHEPRLARRREFDEPFTFLGASPSVQRRFARLVRRRGLDLTRGGRFWHLFSGADKGVAVRKLAALYRRSWRRPFSTLALGDSANDLPLLAAARRAVLLPGPDGRFDRRVTRALPRVRRAVAPGPSGWNEAVLEALARISPRRRRGQ
jgi:mannosyl-3-phosphoglycerate phosphatase family protein